jgi:hypothetical protein
LRLRGNVRVGWLSLKIALSKEALPREAEVNDRKARPLTPMVLVRTALLSPLNDSKAPIVGGEDYHMIQKPYLVSGHTPSL